MDKMIYVAMNGAKNLMLRQENVAHNLANVDTPGFRAQLTAFRAVPLVGDGLPTRALTVDSSPSADYTPGPVRQTGRALDVAVQGTGWIAVQAPDGSQAYTRNGSLQTDAEGVLRTSSGLTVEGDGGPINVPADHVVSVAADGTVSATPLGQGAANSIAVGRIKLVNPAQQELARSDDGLFRLASGDQAPADENVRLSSGALEGSNVNPVDALVDMIALARQYEMQMKLLQSAEANSREASQLFSMGGA
jgi:flagellar basal-body rod protein FlgF